MPEASNPEMNRPLASAPRAAANEPTRLYRVNKRVRWESGTIWERAACSMERNGPTSFPPGLRTPTKAAAPISHRLSVEASTTPAKTISSALTKSMRRRPIRSADVVISRERATSPSKARLSIRPTVAPARPSPVKKRTRLTERNPKPNRRRARLEKSRTKSVRGCPMRPPLADHPLTVGVERVVDDPLSGVDLMIVAESELTKALGDRCQAGPFRLAVKGVVGVGAVDDPAEQHQGRVGGQLILFEDSFEGTPLAVMPQLGAGNVERNRPEPLRFIRHPVRRDKEELRRRVDELADEPGAGDPIDLDVFARDPPHWRGLLTCPARFDPSTLLGAGFGLTPKRAGVSPPLSAEDTLDGKTRASPEAAPPHQPDRAPEGRALSPTEHAPR